MSRESFGFTAGRDVAVFIGVVLLQFFCQPAAWLAHCAGRGSLAHNEINLPQDRFTSLGRTVKAVNTMCGCHLRVSLYLEIKELT